jgi:hypothetical protein
VADVERVDYIRVPVTRMNKSAGVQVNEMWDSGVCRGAGTRDPDGNAILLHWRYAPFPDGTIP